MGKIFSILIVFLFFLIPNVSFSAHSQFFVTQNGSGSRSGKTLEHSWSVNDFNNSLNWSSTSRFDRISPGDIIYFSGMITSVLHVRGSGASNNLITLDGTDAKIIHSSHAPGKINVEQNKYIKIQNFTIDGGYTSGAADRSGIWINSGKHIIIDNNHITRTSMGIWFQGSTENLTISRNHFSLLRHSGIRGGVGSSYVTIGGAPGLGNTFVNVGKTEDGSFVVTGFMNIVGPSHIVVSYNRGYSTDLSYGQTGIYATNWFHGLVEHNIFERGNARQNRPLLTFKGDWGTWRCAQHGPTIIRFNRLSNSHADFNSWGDGSSAINISYNWANYYIYGNYIHDCGGGITYGIAYDSQYHGCNNKRYWQDGIHCENIYIFANIIAETQGPGISVDGFFGDGNDRVINAKVFNNTIYRAGTKATNVGGGLPGGWYPIFNTATAIEYRLNGIQIVDHTYKNNLIMQSRPNDKDHSVMWFHQSGAVNFKNSHNHFYDTRTENFLVRYGSTNYAWNSSTRPCGGQDTIGDPGVVNMTGRDFRLKSGSPLGNNGAAMGTGNIASVNIQGIIHTIPWGFALGPDTVFHSTDPDQIKIHAVFQPAYNGGWAIGAYAYTDTGMGLSTIPQVKGVRVFGFIPE